MFWRYLRRSGLASSFSRARRAKGTGYQLMSSRAAAPKWGSVASWMIAPPDRTLATSCSQVAGFMAIRTSTVRFRAW